jgi:sirohydrochlorin cobaltochelatase
MERPPSAAPATERAIAKGILLVAHGSRDPGWVTPFEQLRERVGAHGHRVVLAYLERMVPDIETAVRELVAQECTHAVVVPLFLGQGGHVREDLPRIVAAEMQRHPSIMLTLMPPIGEDARVLDAIAAACVAHLGAD